MKKPVRKEEAKIVGEKPIIILDIKAAKKRIGKKYFSILFLLEWYKRIQVLIKYIKEIKIDIL